MRPLMMFEIFLHEFTYFLYAENVSFDYKCHTVYSGKFAKKERFDGNAIS